MYDKINVLPTQYDIKGLLQKCVYSILSDENLEGDVEFLCEIKKLLNQIRVPNNFDHLEIIGVINEIYRMAVDKKLGEELKGLGETKIAIDPEVLALFENHYAVFEDSDLVVEEEGEQGEEQDDEQEGENEENEEMECEGEGEEEEEKVADSESN